MMKNMSPEWLAAMSDKMRGAGMDSMAMQDNPLAQLAAAQQGDMSNPDVVKKAAQVCKRNDKSLGVDGCKEGCLGS